MDCTLSVGESVAIRRNFFATTWSVTYAGMPADDRYSIVMTWTMGYHATSYNLYVTEAHREVTFKHGRIHVLEMTPQRIRFQYDRS